MALPRSAAGWFAEWIVVFSDQTHLLSKLDNFRSGPLFDLCFGMHYFVSSLVLQLS